MALWSPGPIGQAPNSNSPHVSTVMHPTPGPGAHPRGGWPVWGVGKAHLLEQDWAFSPPGSETVS